MRHKEIADHLRIHYTTLDKTFLRRAGGKRCDPFQVRRNREHDDG